MDWQKSQLDLNNLTQMWEKTALASAVAKSDGRGRSVSTTFLLVQFLSSHSHPFLPSSFQNQSLSPPFYGPSAAADDVTALLHRGRTITL